MKLFKKIFTTKKEVLEIKQSVNNSLVNQYDEIGKLVKEARVQKNISIEELSKISKIPKYIIDSIENNARVLHRLAYKSMEKFWFCTVWFTPA